MSSVRRKWATFLSFTTLEHRIKRSVWDRKRLVRNWERGRVDPDICRETQLCTVLCLVEQGKAVTRGDVKFSLIKLCTKKFSFWGDKYCQNCNYIFINCYYISFQRKTIFFLSEPGVVLPPASGFGAQNVKFNASPFAWWGVFFFHRYSQAFNVY